MQTPGQGSFQTPQTGALRPAFGGVPANLAGAFGQSSSEQGQPQQRLPPAQPQASFGAKLQGNPFGALPQGNPFGVQTQGSSFVDSHGNAGWGGQGTNAPGHPLDRAQQGQAQPAASAAPGGFGTQNGFGWAEGSLATTSWGAGPSGPTVGQPASQGQQGAASPFGQVASSALICACLAVVRPYNCHKLLCACLSATRLWECYALTKACLAAISSKHCFAHLANAQPLHLHAGASGTPAVTHCSAALPAYRARHYHRSSQAPAALGWHPSQHGKVLQSQGQSLAQPLLRGASSRAMGASRSMLERALATSSRRLAGLAPQQVPLGRTASSCLSCRLGLTSSPVLALGSSPQAPSLQDQLAWEARRRQAPWPNMLAQLLEVHR